jgi:hypothetical protein
MEYVEILRARRVLFWYTLALLGALVITALSAYGGHADMRNGGGTLDFWMLELGCAMGAFIVATCVAPGLIAEASTVGITWTRPAPRARIAWRFIAVDFLAIVLGYAILLAVVLAFFALFGLLHVVHFGPRDLVVFALAMGSAVLWYGLVTLVSSRLPGRGGLIAGLSWVAFVVIGSTWAAPLPPAIHTALTVLSYLNPMAYVGGISGGDGNHHSVHPIVLSEGLRTVLVWVLGLVALVATVRLWSTREV